MNTETLAGMTAARDELYSQWGVAASWQGSSLTPISCTVIPDTAKSNIDIYLQADGRIKTCNVRKSEVAAVRIGKDIVTIDGDEWRVADVLADDALEFQVVLTKEI